MSTGTTGRVPDTQETARWQFVQALKRLVEHKDRGALAALRRGLGRTPGEATEIFPYVVPYLPDGTGPREEEAWYLIASLLLHISLTGSVVKVIAIPVLVHRSTG